MEISVQMIGNPNSNLVEAAWADDAIASASKAGPPVGALVGLPLNAGDGAEAGAWAGAGTGAKAGAGTGAGVMLLFRPDGGGGADGFRLFDSRRPGGSGTARYMQLVRFEGPRSGAWVRAEEQAASQRLWPATRGIAGIVQVLRLRRADNGYMVVVLAESLDALEAAGRAIMSAPLRAEEDPALLGDPDSVVLLRIVRADLPAEATTAP